MSDRHDQWLEKRLGSYRHLAPNRENSQKRVDELT